jgi:hypothetical protein
MRIRALGSGPASCRCAASGGTSIAAPAPSRCSRPVNHEPQRALDDLVTLALVVVHVLLPEEPASAAGDVVRDELAAGLGGRAAHLDRAPDHGTRTRLPAWPSRSFAIE